VKLTSTGTSYSNFASFSSFTVEPSAALRIASSMVALLPTTAVAFGEVDWTFALSASVTSTIVIFFTCLAGVPEVKGGE
jgi:hypothetical protein